jgi:uncharacterized protein
MKYYALFYDVADNYVERRAPYRDTHLKLLKEAHSRGDIVLAGAVGDPPDGALLVWRVEDIETIQNFARNDPYVTSGVVTRWHIKPWHVVAGGV